MFEAIIGNSSLELERNDGDYLFKGEEVVADIRKAGENEWHILYGARSYTLFVHNVNADASEIQLSINGKKTTVHIRSRIARLLKDLGLENAMIPKIDSVKAPMPGLIRNIKVAVGDEVKQGDALVILEAMKMENVIKAPGDGKIARVLVNTNDSVDKNTVLIKFE